MIFEPMVSLVQTVHLTPTLTPSPEDRCEIPRDPYHLGVPSGVSKMISKPNGTFGANHAPILRQD
jgi:hypothetical protein